MKLGIMQPYLFPYIGYFQLIEAVDKFIFYDDVNFIKRGWINRNNILLNKRPHLITLELQKASSNKLINEIEIGNNCNKIIKTIKHNYSKAPYFKDVFPLIVDILDSSDTSNLISEMAANSVVAISKYLQIDVLFEFSSKTCQKSKHLNGQDRILHICTENDANMYINAIGGMSLYQKSEFNIKNIKLQFLQSDPIHYAQFNVDFVPNLSIIDVLMFNSVEQIKILIEKGYTLVQ